MSDKPIRIAVFIPEFKWERMNLHQVKPETHGVELVSVNLEADLSSFDGILHKFTYQLVDGHESDVRRISEYAKSRPGFIVIEPIDNIRIFVDRLVLQNFLKQHPLPPCVEYVEGVEISNQSQPNNISFDFPYILKPVHACGTADSHSIQIIHNEEQLSKVQNNNNCQLLAFPFVPHYGVVFKVYSLAGEIVMRSSGSLVLRNKEATAFDSQKPLPDDLANEAFAASQAEQIAPSMEELKAISDSLQRSTGVQLLGFDILRRESDGKLCLVDFNYFPCFRGVEDVAGKFARFIKSKAETK
ncbi:Inositol 1, 3, 4-trisphosphate 5/6-kinase family protein [Tritrichomonas foetus]|uniref:inositol-1,3,4-trisphosphate 5/6-kinase n=1 Tax=Tritrichomonas foetus TaxID=1144522 RepID=A0A1J4JEZ1_9EUKA|nr:Inositol 1, 3, 4-trisphosphate 5/6-kinase family protein [Tritrichomonas foetus]|eukprot:OHS97241.1 Inositol 1, 3, 4-trisphosphate 5/6-kinase family protein [Tritrichomonas foetus]